MCAIGERLALTPAMTARFPPKYVRLVRACLLPHAHDRPAMVHVRAALEDVFAEVAAAAAAAGGGGGGDGSGLSAMLPPPPPPPPRIAMV